MKGAALSCEGGQRETGDLTQEVESVCVAAPTSEAKADI